MKDQMLHTPDGVRDIYNGECVKWRCLVCADQNLIDHIISPLV